MTATIVNAAPQTNMLGVQDLSTRQLVAEPEVLPTHLPKIYLYAKKGPTTPQLVLGDSAVQMYGAESFDMRMPYATHATELFNVVNAQGNAIMAQRVVPDDAAPPSAIRMCLDVLPTKLTVYERNSDGSIKTDGDGSPVAATPSAQVDGFKIKWVAVPVPTDEDGTLLIGGGTVLAGDQVDGVTSSQRYPMFDLQVSSQGADGNNQGIRLWQPFTTSLTPLDNRLCASRKVLPFRIGCMSRVDARSTASVVETKFAEQYIEAVWKSGVIDPNTDSLMYLGDKFLQSYQTLNVPGMPDQYGPFGALHIYDANISTVLSELYAAEKTAATDFTDLSVDGDPLEEQYLMNIISACTSDGVPYYAVAMAAGGTGVVRPTQNTVVYAVGGSDGTMNEAAFAQSVKSLVAEYANPNSYLMDTAKYPESILYDSGFPLDTKKALAQFIAIRKDTFVALSTHDTSGPALTASQRSSLAVALRTALQLYPESEYYGTSCMRGMVVGGAGDMIGSQYKGKLPLTFEIAHNAAAYMGAGNGVWKSAEAFDSAPGNWVKLFTNVDVTFTPAVVRNQDWDNGLVYVENFSRRQLYFPALQTVYDNDTSVLNSFFTAMACVELEKVGDRARRQFSGTSKLSNGQVIERVNQFVVDNTTNRFDGRFVIKPETYFTAADVARGFSWALKIKIYAPNMKTVQTLTIEAHRIEELATQ